MGKEPQHPEGRRPEEAQRAAHPLEYVEELVPAGGLDPDEIDTPGIYVHRVVVAPRVKRIERRTVRKG